VRREVLADPRHAEYVHERFRREAQTLASLRSRHTTELYDYGVTDDGSFFFVMELLEGLDLSKLVREHGPQPAARVINIITQACSSLAEAHDAGLLHRDIKPANLYLCKAADEVDIVKLLDFGIVHNIAEPIPDERIITAPGGTPPATGQSGERLTSEGVVIGTPGYIPPEQAVGARLDARGDLYALGCVAWWLLVGEEVFPRINGDEALQAHIHEPIPNLRDKVHTWLPRELEDVIVACLSKQPKDRPESARHLARALQAIAIAPEQTWSKEQAEAWWESRTPGATSAPETTTVAGNVVIAKAGTDVATAASAIATGRPPTMPNAGGGAPTVTANKQRLVARSGTERETVASRGTGRG
jgi:serine/threonine protein kinase